MTANDSERKRLPICSILSISCAVGAYYLPRYVRLPFVYYDSTGWGAILYGLYVIAGTCLVGLIFASISGLRRESWPFIGVIALIANLWPLFLLFIMR